MPSTSATAALREISPAVAAIPVLVWANSLKYSSHAGEEPVTDELGGSSLQSVASHACLKHSPERLGELMHRLPKLPR